MGQPMLILTRKANQSIVIGDGDDRVIVTLLESSRYQSRIGITASRKTPVHREEIYRKILAQRQSASICFEASGD